MTNEERYGGWTNYETWVTHLWLANEEPLYREVISMPDPSDLENFVCDHVIGRSIHKGGLASDLLTRSISRVNWKDIFDGLHEGEEEE